MTPEEWAHKIFTDFACSVLQRGRAITFQDVAMRETATAAIRAAIAEEREACAKVADASTAGDSLLHSCTDNHLTDFEHGELHGQRIRYDIAAAIRARP